MQLIKLSLISTDIKDGAIDVRANPLDESRVMLYASQMQAGVKFPSITVMRAPGPQEKYLVIDGRTRFEATRRVGKPAIAAVVASFKNITDARCAAFEANLNSGESVSVPPSKDDYKMFVRALLKGGMSAEVVIKRLVAMGVNKTFGDPLVKEVVSDRRRQALLHATESVEAWLKSEGEKGEDIESASKRYGVTVKKIQESVDARAGLKTLGGNEIGRDIAARFEAMRMYCHRNVTTPAAWEIVRKKVRTFESWVKAQQTSAQE